MISTRQLAALDLVGPDEIGARLQVKANTVAMWAKRYADFPPAELTVSRVGLRRWETVREWAMTHGRVIEVRRGEVSAEDLARAVDLLPKVREQLAREVKAAADAVADLLDEALERPPSLPSTRRAGRYAPKALDDGRATDSAIWDWYFGLSLAERDRLAPYFSDSPGASAPDQWAEAMAWRLGDDMETALLEWRNATALADAARLLAAGKVPTFAYDAATTYPVAEVYGPDGALALALAWSDEADRYQVAGLDPDGEPLPAEPLGPLDPADAF
jgi:hypothetical protein